MPFYAITLTRKSGLSPKNLEAIRNFFRMKSEKCLVVVEQHASGALHVHAGATLAPAQTAAITRLLSRFYVAEDIPVVKGISIKVRNCSDKIGWFHYLTKDLSGPPLLVQGWKMTWIQRICKENLKKIPRKLLIRDDHIISMRDAVRRVISYARRSDLVLTGKCSFINVVSNMQSDGYHFHNVKATWLYVEVLAIIGDMRPARSLWETQLFILE